MKTGNNPGSHPQDRLFTVEQIAAQVMALADRVERLSGRIAVIEQIIPMDRAAPRQRVAAARPSGKNAHAGPQPLLDTSVLLRRISAVCFLLVVALILRTVTDSQIINIRIGSILGMSYAAVLVLVGWRLYSTANRLAPVFPGCGILLLFSIVLETHIRYASLSTAGAYLILFLAGMTVFAMSIRYQVSQLICLAVPGGAAVALAIDFPYPPYPIPGLILLTAVVAASYAFKQGICRYLRWLVLGLAALFWFLWTSKINTLSVLAGPAAQALYPRWFFPMLFAFWGVYLTTVVLNILRKELRLGFFESVLPTLTAVGAFSAGQIAFRGRQDQPDWFYLITAVIAVLHLALAWWLAGVDREKGRGSNVFILAGACLIILTSATVFRKDLGTILPAWSASALALALLSGFLQNQGIRITSYLMQGVTCTTAIASGVIRVPAESPAAGGAAAGIFLLSLIQYHWSRANPPNQANSWYYSRIDPGDRSRMVLLISGLAGGYYFFQFVLHEALARLMTDFNHALQGGQSLIINIGALGLLYLALVKRDRELVLAAAMVALLGAGKVVFFDLFGIKGVPLVLGVFSTGLVAAFGSVVLGRWQKKKAGAAEQPPLSPSG